MYGAFSTFIEYSERYVRVLAANIKTFSEENGNVQCIDIIGHSQGGFFARAYLQMFSQNDSYPGVRRLYSLSGVMAGYFCYYRCGLVTNPALISVAQILTMPTFVYSLAARFLIVPVSEWRSSKYESQYRSSKNLISVINGDNLSVHTAVGRQSVVNLDQLVTFWSPDDEVIEPAETSKFAFLADESLDTVLEYDEYIKQFYGGRDKIGLLDLKSRWHKVEVPGFRHRDYIDLKVEEFYFNCLRYYLLLDNGELEGGESSIHQTCNKLEKT